MGFDNKTRADIIRWRIVNEVILDAPSILRIFIERSESLRDAMVSLNHIRRDVPFGCVVVGKSLSGRLMYLGHNDWRFSLYP